MGTQRLITSYRISSHLYEVFIAWHPVRMPGVVESDGVLLVPKVGEMLYRLTNPPVWAQVD